MSGVDVRAIVLAAGAFVGGLVLGGLQPRSEIRSLKAEIFELEKARVTPDGGAVGRELAELITRGLDDARVEAPPAVEAEPSPEAIVPVETDLRGVGEAPVKLVVDEDAPGDETPLAAARDMLAMRSAQARAALIEDANPDQGQLDAIDEAFAGMNDSLYALAQDVVDHVSAHGEPGRREAMMWGADALDAMVAAENDVLASLSPEQVANLREDASDPTSFVDPGVIEVLMEIDGFVP